MIAPLAAAVLTAALTTAPTAPPKPCPDAIVNVLREAGWKGHQVRVAYGVAWRESNMDPLEVSDSDDWGLLQLNRPTWGGTKYWPREPLNALSNAKAAHRLWKDAGWRPWGLNRNGTGVDMRDYNWSSWQIDNWVWAPYVDGLRRFDRLPKACRS